jgi:hypothetical protein
MKGFVLVEFSSARDAVAAARAAKEAGVPALDMLLPHALEGAAGHLAPAHRRKPIGWIMFGTAFLGAIAGYFLQWYSSLYAYPINSGGRPLNSWPIFVIVPYEAAILMAALFGFFGWLFLCRLPKLHHPLFAAESVERGVQDRYLLVFPREDGTAKKVRELLNPLSVEEVRE